MVIETFNCPKCSYPFTIEKSMDLHFKENKCPANRIAFTSFAKKLNVLIRNININTFYDDVIKLLHIEEHIKFKKIILNYLKKDNLESDYEFDYAIYASGIDKNIIMNIIEKVHTSQP